jgi:outer membrane protein OmpA-like peptidoglycan-associated protein
MSALYPAQIMAQDYVPPPLFDTPPSPVEEARPETIVKPPVVKETIERKAAPEPLPAVPPPPHKPKVKRNFNLKPKTTPVTEPQRTKQVTPVKKKDIPPPPASRGVVKGPKTMPSAPAKSVESEVLFEAPENTPSPLPIPKKVESIPTEPEDIPPLPAFKELSNGALQSILYFVSITEELSANHKATIKHLIIPELKKNDKKRLLIQAYAASQEDVLSGDRRISLSRALNVRRFLIEQGINPSRLNVRAMGAQTNKQPLDRVELIIS